LFSSYLSHKTSQIIFFTGNSVKFSNDNSYIDLKCNIITDTTNGKRIRFSVKDYGKGIAKENYTAIFKPFHQENKDTGTIYGGTGLGLPITAKLTEKLGGEISVQSELGKWTEFTVEFPFHGQEVTDFEIENAVACLANTSVIVVVARPTTDCPVMIWLREQSITVKLVASCNELEAAASKIEAKYPEQYYIVLMHDEAFREDLYCRFAESHQSQLMTFGYQNIAMAAAHVHSPCRVFPSLLLPILGDLVARSKTGKIERIETRLDSSILVINNQKDEVDKAALAPVTCESYSDLRILIAEDNKVNTKVLTNTLKRLGLHRIDAVDNGKKAVQAASEKIYDLIFMVRLDQHPSK